MTDSGILIIDDEPGIRRSLASILEDERYQVFTAEDAIIGLDLLKKEKITQNAVTMKPFLQND